MNKAHQHMIDMLKDQLILVSSVWNMVILQFHLRAILKLLNRYSVPFGTVKIFKSSLLTIGHYPKCSDHMLIQMNLDEY